MKNDNSKFITDGLTMRDIYSSEMRIIKPNPQKYPKAFSKLKMQQANVLLLKLAGFTYKEIKQYYPFSTRTLKRWIKDAVKEYPEVNKYL